MNLINTGRVRSWFEHDLGLIRPTLRAEHNGLVSYPTPGPGRPLMWRMPHPLHPLETIASLRGWGGLEGPNLLREGFRIMQAGELRTGDRMGVRGGWLVVTADIAEHLFVPPATVRFLWHVLTPLNVGRLDSRDEHEGVVNTLRRWWYSDAGFDRFEPAYPTTPHRPDFWTKELRGDVEL